MKLKNSQHVRTNADSIDVSVCKKNIPKCEQVWCVEFT